MWNNNQSKTLKYTPSLLEIQVQQGCWLFLMKDVVITQALWKLYKCAFFVANRQQLFHQLSSLNLKNEYWGIQASSWNSHFI